MLSAITLCLNATREKEPCSLSLNFWGSLQRLFLIVTESQRRLQSEKCMRGRCCWVHYTISAVSPGPHSEHVPTVKTAEMRERVKAVPDHDASKTDTIELFHRQLHMEGPLSAYPNQVVADTVRISAYHPYKVVRRQQLKLQDAADSAVSGWSHWPMQTSGLTKQTSSVRSGQQ